MKCVGVSNLKLANKLKLNLFFHQQETSPAFQNTSAKTTPNNKQFTPRSTPSPKPFAQSPCNVPFSPTDKNPISQLMELEQANKNLKIECKFETMGENQQKMLFVNKKCC